MVDRGLTGKRQLGAYATILWALLLLFFLRVLGQVLVAAFAVSFLPPMSEWYSGLIAYPILLPIQMLIIILLTKVCLDFTRGRGFFVLQRPAAGRALLWFGWIYFGGMVIRYIVTMAVHPERRWLGGTIPIFFHFVLATYVLVVGHYHAKPRT